MVVRFEECTSENNGGGKDVGNDREIENKDERENEREAEGGDGGIQQGNYRGSRERNEEKTKLLSEENKT